MKLKFQNPSKKYFFILYLAYLASCSLLFAFFNVHLSTLGDYRLYSRGTFDLSYSPEVITINVYTALSFFGINQILLTFLFIGPLTYYYVNRVSQSAINCLIYFSVFNPFCLQFFIYESKEALLSIFSIIVLSAGMGNIIKFICVLFIASIRQMYLPVLIIAHLNINNKFLYIGRKHFISISALAILPLIYILEAYNYTPSLINSIKNSFLPYAQATTNRDWIPVVSSVLSLDFLIWYLIGMFTVFFGQMSFHPYTIFFLIVGLGKVLLFIKVTKLRLGYVYIWLLALSIYAVPLSVYNVGSGLRYSIPFFIVLLFSFIKAQCSEVRK